MMTDLEIILGEALEDLLIHIGMGWDPAELPIEAALAAFKKFQTAREENTRNQPFPS